MSSVLFSINQEKNARYRVLILSISMAKAIAALHALLPLQFWDKKPSDVQKHSNETDQHQELWNATDYDCSLNQGVFHEQTMTSLQLKQGGNTGLSKYQSEVVHRRSLADYEPGTWPKPTPMFATFIPLCSKHSPQTCPIQHMENCNPSPECTPL